MDTASATPFRCLSSQSRRTWAVHACVAPGAQECLQDAEHDRIARRPATASEWYQDRIQLAIVRTGATPSLAPPAPLPGMYVPYLARSSRAGLRAASDLVVHRRTWCPIGQADIRHELAAGLRS